MHTGSSGAGDALLDQILERIKNGEEPDVERLAREHPARAEDIRRLLTVVQFVRSAAKSCDPSAELDARVQLSRKRPVLGDFRIEREIARGGMGVVYEAVQQSLGRRVALKVLLPGVTFQEEALERFGREARAAGGLHHGNIVPVYAVGEADGMPYYAMQFIDGRTLSAIVKERRSANEATDQEYCRRVVEWGRQAASALSYAHGRGVIHRDIKPSNMLLDEDNNVWVTDFGLARQDTNMTITLSGDVLGTVRYMSPEQARGGSAVVDERTDVYSLGVSLYEMLTLRPPFEGPDRESTLKQVLFDEPRRMRQLDAAIPKALETIVHKALDKEPAQRYASAALLAEDLRRYLNDEPLLAKPLGLWGQLRRLIVRHRAAAVFVLVVFGLLTVFGAVATYQAFRIREERNRAVVAAQKETSARRSAESARDQAEGINTFLQNMLLAADPETAGYDVTVKEVVEWAARDVEESMSDDPEIDAAIRHTIGRVFQTMGRYDESEHHLRESLRLRRELQDTPIVQLLATLNELASTLVLAGSTSEAEELFREALRIGEQHPDADDGFGRATALNGLANALLAQTGREAEAESCYREALEINRARGERTSTPDVLDNMGNLLVARGDFGGGEELLNEALEMRRRIQSPDHPALANSLNNLAHLHWQRGDYEEAERLQREALEIYRERYGERHPLVAVLLNNLAMSLSEQGDYDGAEPYARQALHLWRDRLGEHPKVATGINNLGLITLQKGDHAGAEPLFREALALRRKLLGNEHQDVAVALNNLASALDGQEKYDEAEPMYREALALFRRMLGDDHPQLGMILNNLGHLLHAKGDYAGAEQVDREAVAIFRKRLGDRHPVLASGLNNHGRALAALEKYSAAESTLLEALDIRKERLPAGHTDITTSFRTLADLYEKWGKPDKAAEYRVLLDVDQPDTASAEP